MNQAAIQKILEKSLAGEAAFPEHLANLRKQGVECYHVDFRRNEYTYYAENGESCVLPAPLEHNGVAREFSVQAIDQLNKRNQAGTATYRDFIREGTAAGCAYYIVFLNGGKVRYFGRDGGEHLQEFPVPQATA